MKKNRPTRSAEARVAAIVKRNRSTVTHYRVIVGNIGTVYNGYDLRTARITYRAYVKSSESGHGRGAHEPVTMLRDGRMYCEFNPAHFTDMEAA